MPPFAARPPNRRCVVCLCWEHQIFLAPSLSAVGPGVSWMLASGNNACVQQTFNLCGSFRGGERDGARRWGGVACIDYLIVEPKQIKA